MTVYTKYNFFLIKFKNKGWHHSTGTSILACTMIMCAHTDVVSHHSKSTLQDAYTVVIS